MSKQIDSRQNPELRELTGDERARFRALADASLELLAGALDSDESLQAALAQFRQIGSGIELDAWLDALHVPEDAGPYEAALRRILARIPDGWGRWISCGKGWYPIIAELDEQLSALDPLYRVQQVKEKFGGLCYYSSFSGLRTHYERQCAYPGTSAPKDRRDAWRDEFNRFADSTQGRRLADELKRRREQIDALIGAAQRRAAQTCELCGQPAEMRMTQGRSPWYRTLCEDCAARDGYITEAEWTAWYERERPRFEAEDRARSEQRHRDFLARHVSRRVLHAGGDRELALAAVRPADVAAARAAAFEDWDAIFIGSDAVGQAFVDGLAERYAEQLAANAQAKAQFDRERMNGQRSGMSMFLPRPPETLRDVTMTGPINTIRTGPLHDLGVTVHGSMDYQFADFTA